LSSAEPNPAIRYHAPADETEEWELIREALWQEGGNRTRAARRLGMSRSALWMKLRIYADRLAADTPGHASGPATPERLRTGTGALALVSTPHTVAEPEC
jgi:hypothetical protein